jgi:hypothetical protein
MSQKISLDDVLKNLQAQVVAPDQVRGGFDADVQDGCHVKTRTGWVCTIEIHPIGDTTTRG